MKSNEKFELLKLEMQLLQSTLDKYDDLIFRSRNFFITLWTGCIGLAFTIKSNEVVLLGSILAILYWLFEGMMRHQYWFKYVDRYRFLRDSLNSKVTLEFNISVYDLTNHYHRVKERKLSKFKTCFFKIEPTLTYWSMGGAATFIWYLLDCALISFPTIKVS